VISRAYKFGAVKKKHSTPGTEPFTAAIALAH
jgi:hypothetical protein